MGREREMGVGKGERENERDPLTEEPLYFLA